MATTLVISETTLDELRSALRGTVIAAAGCGLRSRPHAPQRDDRQAPGGDRTLHRRRGRRGRS